MRYSTTHQSVYQFLEAQGFSPSARENIMLWHRYPDVTWGFATRNRFRISRILQVKRFGSALVVLTTHQESGRKKGLFYSESWVEVDCFDSKRHYPYTFTVPEHSKEYQFWRVKVEGRYNRTLSPGSSEGYGGGFREFTEIVSVKQKGSAIMVRLCNPNTPPAYRSYYETFKCTPTFWRRHVSSYKLYEWQTKRRGGRKSAEVEAQRSERGDSRLATEVPSTRKGAVGTKLSAGALRDTN